MQWKKFNIFSTQPLGTLKKSSQEPRKSVILNTNLANDTKLLLPPNEFALYVKHEFDEL